MTREEAINLVKQVLPCLNVDEKIREGFKTLIPELAESEEERMVKAITHILYENYTDAAVVEGVEIAEIVTWLEKQKEQKSVQCIDFDNEFENQVSHLLASVLNGEWEYNEGFIKHAAQSLMGYAKNEMKQTKPNEQDEWDKREKLFTKALQTANARIGQLFEENRKLKEQKPTEWSEEDSLHLTNAILSAEKEWGNESCTAKWLKSLPERFNLQPKEEWSEEDDKMCNSILNELTLHLVYDGTYTGTTLGKKYKYGSEIRWIKSLPERFNLQPKKEQSEYDENMDKECIKLCNTLNSIPSVDTFESCCGHLKDSYSVWFFCNDIIAISRLGRCVERNYSDGKWELLVDSTDTHPTGVFWLRSKVPFQSYDEMEESVNELCVCIQHWFNTKFDSYFNSNACK